MLHIIIVTFTIGAKVAGIHKPKKTEMTLQVKPPGAVW